MSFCRTIRQATIFALVLTASALAKSPVPVEVRSAKTVYLINETGDEKVLATATDQFTNWGRFTISESKDNADLVVVFTHKNGITKWGNAGITEMDVFVIGQKEPAFTSKNAFRLITDMHRPTKACIWDFRERLEAKN